MSRAKPAALVTFRGPEQQVSAPLPRALFDRLEAHCKRTNTTKAAFIRSAIEHELDQFKERDDG